jgi:predicted nucleic acid-binding protein
LIVAVFITFDTEVIGLLCSSPNLPNILACQTWVKGMIAIQAELVLPDVTIYEYRREMIRLRATAKLARLDNLIFVLGSVRVTPEAWLKAAEFWAMVRSTGKPTADPHALDGDAILAGVAATIGKVSDSVTIATTNVGHLSRFPGVDARRWETIS